MTCRKQLLLSLFLLILVYIVYLDLNKTKAEPLIINYIITETAGPESFDPLNADKTQNLSVMRMLYFTPFEVDKNNLLKSSVFENFEYNYESSTLTLKKKNHLYFEDGSPIETKDILLAIIRMAYFRPDFPMIKDIIGVKEWSYSKNGLSTLPQGIESSNSKIVIKFRKKMLNPMFRLCLELFSIVPARCIDLSTGKFICDIAPASGYFRISKKSDKVIEFTKRTLKSRAAENINIDKITFKFSKFSQLCGMNVAENDIIAVSELDYHNTKCSFTDASFHWLAATRFGILRFNTNVELFKSADLRNYFAELVRKKIDLMNVGMRSTRSLLPPLLPGYLPDNDFSTSTTQNTKEFFRKQKITLVSEQAPVMPFIYKAILETAKSLEMEIEIINLKNNEDIVNGFLENKITIIAGASGFWAQDPVGDISMWFTKELHKTMTFVWKDSKLYNLLEEVENETHDSKLGERIKDLNRHIYNSSIIAPLVHFRRLYITNSNTKSLNIPQAITSPAPWQITL